MTPVHDDRTALPFAPTDVPTTLYIDRYEIDVPGSLVHRAGVDSQEAANELWRRVYGQPYPGGQGTAPPAPTATSRRGAYAAPGTPEHDEYERLSAEILHCTDVGRAGRIADRLIELRGDTRDRLPVREPFWRQLVRALARNTPAFRG